MNLINIYKVLKEHLPKNLTTKLSYTELSKINNEKSIVTEDTVIISMDSANDGDRVIDGSYTTDYVLVKFKVYTCRGEEGVHSGHEYCSRACDNLDKLFGKEFKVDDTLVFILDSKRLGNYSYRGPTKQGINTFSFSYLIKYEGGN